MVADAIEELTASPRTSHTNSLSPTPFPRPLVPMPMRPMTPPPSSNLYGSMASSATLDSAPMHTSTANHPPLPESSSSSSSLSASFSRINVNGPHGGLDRTSNAAHHPATIPPCCGTVAAVNVATATLSGAPQAPGSMSHPGGLLTGVHRQNSHSTITSPAGSTTTTTPSSTTLPLTTPCPATATSRLTVLAHCNGLASQRCSCMHVVIIGAGIAGVSVATTLARRLGPDTSTTISLIDPRNYVEIRWAVIRALFDPAIASSCVISLKEGLTQYPCIRHIPAQVVSLGADSVTLHTGNVMPFDVCLLATGSVPDYTLLSSPHPDVKKRREQLATEGRRLTRAPSVLIVGGGPVGAELAGYLACHARKQRRTPQVTVIHHGHYLADPLGSRASERLADQLTHLGVDVVLGEAAEFRKDAGHWVIASSGRVLNCAEVVTPTGVNAAPGGAGDLLRGMRKTGVDALVDERGWVHTDKFGRVGKQVSPTNTIFAMGDCTQQPYKSGVTIIANRKNMAHNLHVAVEACIAARRGQEFYVEKKLKPILTPSTTSVAVLAGPNAGVVQTRFFVDDVLLPTWRSRVTLSLSKVRTDLGL